MMRLCLSTILILLLVGLTAACEEDVVAVVGTEQPYSVWGVLNPLADTQFVRVFPVEGTLTPGNPEALDASFTSTNRTTENVRVWRDSVLVDDQGLVEHIFYAPLQVEYGHSYRLEILGGDGRASSVDVDVPARTSLALGEPDSSSSILLPVYVLDNPPNLIRSEVELGLSYITGFTASGCPEYQYIEHALRYDDRIRPVEGGWGILVNLNEVYGEIQSLLRDDDDYLPQYGVTLGFIRFNTIVANEEWTPPDGSFDPNVLIQPGTMENVENGFGFVGAGYQLSRLWVLTAGVIERSGFRTDFEGCR